MPGQGKVISVVLRYDDYYGETPNLVEKGIMKIAQRLQVALTIGVVPNYKGQMPLAGESLQTLLCGIASGRIEVAQHGWTHEKTGMFSGSWTEFAGLSYKEQKSRIIQGRDFLERGLGIKPVSFIPPYNTYDDCTAHCLQELGFRVLSGDWRNSGWLDSDVLSIPMTCELSQLRAVISNARATGDSNPLITALFHAYDFREINNEHASLSLDEALRELEWLSSQEDVETVTLSEAAARHPEFNGRHQAMVSRWLYFESFLPCALQSAYTHKGIYPGMQDGKRRVVTSLLKTAFIYSLVCALTGALLVAIRNLCVNHSSRLATLANLASAIMIVVAFTYVLHDGRFHRRKLLAFVVAIGGSLGWFLSNGS